MPDNNAMHAELASVPVHFTTTPAPPWSGKHQAAFLLKQKANLSAEQLASVNEAATREIKVIQTWINLSHAVTVKPVSAESLGVSK